MRLQFDPHQRIKAEVCGQRRRRRHLRGFDAGGAGNGGAHGGEHHNIVAAGAESFGFDGALFQQVLDEGAHLTALYFARGRARQGGIVDFDDGGSLPAGHLVSALHEYFTSFDEIVEEFGLEKLKTIGDAYMLVSGLPKPRAAHAVDAVLAALKMVDVVEELAGRVSAQETGRKRTAPSGLTRLKGERGS